MKKVSTTRPVRFEKVPPKGEKGAVLRGPREWQAGTVYQGGQNGDEYLDVVVYANQCYQCTATHTSSESSTPDKLKHWKVGTMFDLIVSKLGFFGAGKLGKFHFDGRYLRSENGSLWIDAVTGEIVQHNTEPGMAGAGTRLIGGRLQLCSYLSGKDKDGEEDLRKWEFGFDEKRNPILSYYKKSGEISYGLGPDKIFELPSRGPRWEPLKLAKMIDGSDWAWQIGRAHV